MVGRHLKRIHGSELSDAALPAEVQRSFDSYARYWVEAFRLSKFSADDLDRGLSYEGLEYIEEARARGRGSIMALPHLGGWEYGGAWLTTHGFPITVVVEPLEPRELFEWFVQLREQLGMTVVPLGPRAGAEVLHALGRNELVGLLCDRDLVGGGVEVEFFGERTTLPAGPVTLALRSGAPILPTAVYFDDAGHHHGVVRPPLDLTRRGSLREDIARITQLLASELEILIAAAPEQWHVFQPNWPSDGDLSS